MSKLKLIFLLAFTTMLTVQAQQNPKREFRGAWIQTVYQSQYQNMDRDEMQAYFTDILDKLKQCGINAVIFQIRPMADAFYKSQLEPWSKYLTGRQGQAPSPEWDPLEFMIEECHKRNMELHAWMNPYRVATGGTEPTDPNHIYYQHPEWFVRYNNQILFDPGLPQSRKFIYQVVADVVKRYDIDAIHMDDYFYPYPAGGEDFPDDDSFNTYREQMGFSLNQRDDWRRQNVNILVKTLHETIHSIKPWVRFGISPFGIYRNQKSSPDGSETNGLQNYDNLYADVLLWTEKGWVDYMMPQLYWEIGHKAACSETLIYWWNEHANNRPLYIGQDVKRTMDATDLNTSRSQLARKIQLSRYLDNISGNCFWPASTLIENYGGVASLLYADYHRRPALIPAYDFIDSKAPKEVSSLKASWTSDGYLLHWKPRKTNDEMQKQIYYCIYRFAENEPIDLSDASHLVATTRYTAYMMPYKDGKTKYIYVVTAVDRMHNESPKGKSKKVEL